MAFLVSAGVACTDTAHRPSQRVRELRQAGATPDTSPELRSLLNYLQQHVPQQPSRSRLFLSLLISLSPK